MPEIGLGIGRGSYLDGEVELEVLYWYDAQSVRYKTPEEVAKQERNQRQLAQQQAAEMTELLERYRQRFGELPDA